METSKEIALINEARRALEAAKTLDEVLAIADRARAIRLLLRTAKQSREAQNDAAEVCLRAHRKAGGMLQVEVTSCNQHTGAVLADLDITKAESHRFQRIATMPDEDFEGYITEVKASGVELSQAGVLARAKKLLQDEKLEEIESGPGSSVEDLASATRRYRCIYADPPWKYGNQGTRAATNNHYPTMSVDDICNLPVESIAADDAHLHLWTTNAFLPDAFRVMAAWGFTYKSVFVWVKPQMGIGNYWRVSHEFMLLGVRGRLPFMSRSEMSWLSAPRTRHSAKPEEVRSAIERVSPGPRIELFCRYPKEGWDYWGNEVARSLFTIEEESA